MTKDEERVKLAEVMGRTGIKHYNAKTAKGWYGCPPGVKDEINKVGNGPHKEELPNPRESWDDCMAEVEGICPYHYAVKIYKSRLSGLYTVHLTVWKENVIKGRIYFGEAETPQAAICAALLKYLEVCDET